ncbi:TPA: CpsB/CapC family capsule biosynthesis tyrosine phosphatase [Streptococcus suis]
MIDIHSHIIFGVDDGPQTIEESLALLDEAYHQGIRVVVATSHRRKGMFETPEEIIKDHFIQLKEATEKRYPDLVLYYGGELYYSADLIEKLEKGTVPTLNGTRQILLEFSRNTSWQTIQTAVDKVTLLGLTPLLAHIERYDALAFNAERVEELIYKGCYTQVNSHHVLKPSFIGDRAKELKKRTQFFLENDLVYCVGSDMHNTTTRPPYMKKAYQFLAKKYGEERAKALLKTNPWKLLNE